MSSADIAVNEALDAALNSEGVRDRSRGFALDVPQPNDHKRDRVRRLLLRVVSELPDDMTVSEIREALQ